MRIEISIDGEEPVSYPLADRMTVGADEACTISINSKEISLIHLEVTVDEGKIYVADQGSRNGSFIDDARLEAKTRHEIRPYLAVRLGASILLTLVPETEKEKTGFIVNPLQKQPARQASDKTVTISKLELEKVNTKKLVKKKNKKVAKKKKSSSLLPMFLLLIIAGGVVYWKFFTTPELPAPAPVAKVPEVKKAEAPAKAPEESPVPVSAEKANDPFEELVETPGCPEEIEKKICEANPQSVTSARLKDATLYILIDSKEFITQAKLIAEKTVPAGSSPDIVAEETVKISTALFMAKGITNFPYEELSGKEIIFRNVRKFPMKTVLTTMIKTSTNRLKALKERLTPEVIAAMEEKGTSQIEFTKEYIEIIRNQGVEYKTEPKAETVPESGAVN